MNNTARKITTALLHDEGSAAYKAGARGSAPRELSDADAYHWACGYFEAERAFQRDQKYELSIQIDAIDDLEGVREVLRVMCEHFKLI